jgi:hypothetical protein
MQTTLKIGRAMAGGVVALAATAISAPLHADTSFPAVGGSGYTSADDHCPRGEWLVGFRGRSGYWVDQIRIVCASFNAQGIQNRPKNGPERGGMGGGPQDVVCPNDSAVAAIHTFNTAYGRQVKMIDVKWGSMSANRQVVIRLNPNAPTSTITTGSEDKWWQICPSGETGAGYHVNFGKDVNAIGLFCRRR